MTAFRKPVSEKKRRANSKFPFKLSMRLTESAYEAFDGWCNKNPDRISSHAHGFRALLDMLPSGTSPLTQAQVKSVFAAAETARASDSNPTSRWDSSKGSKMLLRLRPAITEEQHYKLNAVITQVTNHCRTADVATLSDGAIAYGLLKVLGEAALKKLATLPAETTKKAATSKPAAADAATADGSTN
jgi:hypothetical protein